VPCITCDRESVPRSPERRGNQREATRAENKDTSKGRKKPDKTERGRRKHEEDEGGGDGKKRRRGRGPGRADGGRREGRRKEGGRRRNGGRREGGRRKEGGGGRAQDRDKEAARPAAKAQKSEDGKGRRWTVVVVVAWVGFRTTIEFSASTSRVANDESARRVISEPEAEVAGRKGGGTTRGDERRTRHAQAEEPQQRRAPGLWWSRRKRFRWGAVTVCGVVDSVVARRFSRRRTRP